MSSRTGSRPLEYASPFYLKTGCTKEL
ncbi:hypothetical protein CGLO_14564 [Colletotrichum gloeosporioides Cg-14]|uniref:Uncharacterized protein n=1 Tax=Colletotrichum gloeosporioides (strain Cg-14) TaxID=1237896 RepID=T0L400_COLGC|nr:hypothetical protein CGLO_14564 [Colletotrichum gloeosporioides Cg-14]